MEEDQKQSRTNGSNCVCWCFGRDTTREANGERDKNQSISFTHMQKISLLMLALGAFMSVCSMSIISPFFPTVSAKKGVTASLSGLIFGVYALVVFLSSPVFGKVLPKVGAKPMFTIGAFVSGVSNMIFGLIDRLDNYPSFVAASFIIRIIEALGASAYNIASYVLIVDLFPNHVGTIRGLLETFIGLGLSAGPGIGGLLYAVGGFSLPFYVSGSIAIVIAVVNMFVLPQPKKEVLEKGGSLINLLRLPSVFVTCVMTVVVAVSVSFLDPTLEPHLREKFGLSPSQVGLLFVLSAATYGISSPIMGWIGDKTNSYVALMSSGLLGSFLMLLFLGPSPIFSFIEGSLWLNAVTLGILGIFAAMTLIPTYQHIIDNALEEGFPDCLSTHSAISGLWSSAYSLGEVIGPIMGGALMQKYSFPIASSTVAGINLILAIGGAVFFKIKKRRKVMKVMSSSEDKCGIDNAICCVESEGRVSYCVRL
ncbi:MFS-type transporter SLC18B1-like [Euwallacea fornicatus]|uniref:MFS-type transporter SLC18B1-like n=1 Tax=Euwallacea fornicatus TaxID=995702 RepID=UPI00338ED6F2